MCESGGEIDRESKRAWICVCAYECVCVCVNACVRVCVREFVCTCVRI